MLNAVEPGTVVPIHRHTTKDESFVILRVTTHKDDGGIMEDGGGRLERGCYGGNIPGNVLKPRYPYRPESIWCMCPSLSSVS